jgi:hypothetical protein
MISELNQPARIASLECGLLKIPCLPEVSLSIRCAACMNFIALFGWRPDQHILFSFFFRFSPVHVH